MRGEPVDRDFLDTIMRRLDAIERRASKLRNNNRPTLPFYSSLNWPHNNVEGQIVIAPATIAGFPSGPVLYSLYYTQATFPTGPFAGDDNDYCHLAYADETGKDHFIDQDPNWDQAYGVWSPDYTKVCYTQADRKNINSGAWPRGFTSLAPPIPRNPVDFPGTPSHGSIAAGATVTFNTGATGGMNAYTTVVPTGGSGSVEFYLCANAALTTGYKITVTRAAGTGGNWTITFVNLDTSTTIATTTGFGFRNFTDIGVQLPQSGILRLYFRDASTGPINWTWQGGLGSATPPLHTGTYVGIVNNTTSAGTWGGGLPDAIPLYSLVIQNLDGSNKTILRNDTFCYPNIISYDNTMVAYGVSSGTGSIYHITDYRVVNADGSDDRSIFGPGGYVTSGTGFVQGSFSYIMQWTPNNKIAIWWQKYDTSGSSPYPILENELRLYEPDGSGDYVVAWDAEAYRVAHGIPQYDSDTGQRSWSPWYNGDVSINGDYIIGWSGPRIDTGVVVSGFHVKTHDYIAVTFPCVEGATPTFIHADDVSWKNWTMWNTTYTVAGSPVVIREMEPLQQPYWSPDGTEVLDHYEYNAPSWDFREWIALAFKPSDLSHRSFAHNPLSTTDPNYESITGDAWESPDSTPPFARNSYIPTWWKTNIAMTAARDYDPDADPDDPDALASVTFAFINITYKKLDNTFGWLAVDTQGEQGYIAPYTGPDYLYGGYVDERMLITGISRQSYFEDQQLA